MSEPPSLVGARAEAAVAYALVATGHEVFFPLFGANGRIDLVATIDNAFRGIQCKTARLRDDCIFFRTCSNTANKPMSYSEEIDYFGVFAPAIQQVYLVPAEGLPTRIASLRLAEPKNNQRQGIRWAAPYLLAATVPLQPEIDAGSSLLRS